jgi:hypothetical protein
MKNAVWSELFEWAYPLERTAYPTAAEILVNPVFGIQNSLFHKTEILNLALFRPQLQKILGFAGFCDVENLWLAMALKMHTQVERVSRRLHCP